MTKSVDTLVSIDTMLSKSFHGYINIYIHQPNFTAYAEVTLGSILPKVVLLTTYYFMASLFEILFTHQLVLLLIV